MQNKFTEVANKITTIKSGFAEAISAKGVQTAPNASFSDMIANVGSITGGGAAEEEIVVPEVAPWVKPHDWPNIEEAVLKPNSMRILMCDAYDGGEQEIVFNRRSGQTYTQAVINWGDGSPEDEVLEIGSSYTIKHKFRKEGGTPCDRGYNTYIVNITFGDPNKKNIPGSTKFKKSGGDYSTAKYNNLLWVYADFTDIETVSNLYGGVSDYTASPALERVKYVNTSTITSMYYAFNKCTGLVSVEPFDTSNVTNMSYAFNSCYSLQKLPSLDTSKVAFVENMFEKCYSLLDVSWLNVTSKVSDVSNIFRECRNLMKLPKQLDFSNVKSSLSAFQNCYALTFIPDLTFSPSITNITFLFSDCKALKKIPSLMNTSKVTNWSHAFSGCSAITSIPDTIDFSSIKEANNLFYECSALTKLPNLPFEQVTNMDNMFNKCSMLSTLPSTFTTVNATGVSNLFYNCKALAQIKSLDTGKATKVNELFNTCVNLKEVGNLDFSAATSKYNNYNHFSYCESLQRIGTIKLGKFIELKIEKCPLTAISFAYDEQNVPAFTETVPIKLNHTQLDKAALDKLMTQLPNGNGKTLDIKYNPGSKTCDTSIATSKNWTVLV